MSSEVTLPTEGHADLIVVESYRSEGDAAPLLEQFPARLTVPREPGDRAGEAWDRAGDAGVQNGAEVRVLGAVVIPGDEVVFYLVTGPSIARVRQAFDAQGIDCVRIVTGAWVGGRPGRPVGPGAAPEPQPG